MQIVNLVIDCTSASHSASQVSYRCYCICNFFERMKRETTPRRKELRALYERLCPLIDSQILSSFGEQVHPNCLTLQRKQEMNWQLTLH